MLTIFKGDIVARVLFEKSRSGYRTVRGQIIKRIQSSLKKAGMSPGDIDGIFGKDTKAALIEWQQAKGFVQTGSVDVETWKSIVSEDIPTIFDRALQLTAEFEGHNFEKAVGNFDNAWLTWGIIGFTLKHGEIQKIIKEIHQKHPTIIKSSFGELEKELLDVINGSSNEQRNWSNKISIGRNRYRILPTWEEAFEKLGSFPEVQAIQVQGAQRYWDIAKRDVNRFSLKTEASIALCFDIAVQNGGIDSTEARKIKRKLSSIDPTDEEDVRVIISNVVAENSNPRWIEDVRKRKLTIATGEGVVHGSRYQISTWGIGEFPI
ncbi:MAG: peptidoglycan-binding protein [Cyanothece sp. SIO1E1]|nr:peptidoglycan-binding protein [Cyanothece sp. SIO1E1]